MHVLLIGGYKPLIKPLKQGLEEEGFTVEVASDGREEKSPVPAAGYDAIVLDLMCPREAGLCLLQNWRRAGLKSRVLVLAAPGSIHDQIPALDSGADDWLTKPFELDELLTRLRALFSRTDPVTNPSAATARNSRRQPLPARRAVGSP
jgi:DNA-binding response OmpR family regulator